MTERESYLKNEIYLKDEHTAICNTKTPENEII